MSEEHKSRYELWLEEEARKAQPTKQCSKCKEVKALSEFYKNNARKVGVKPRCKLCMSEKKYKNRVDWFWKAFHIRTKMVDNCLIWLGDRSGANKRIPRCGWEGKRVNVRRVVYGLAIGEVPEDMLVLTTCHTPLCVRQSHLILATHEEYEATRDNSRAAGNKHGTHTRPDSVPCGEKHRSAKLTESDVRAILSEYIQGEASGKMLAERFGVSPSMISRIVQRKNWTHVE